MGKERYVVLRRLGSCERSFEFLQSKRGRVVSGEAGRSAKLVGERMERAILVVRRAEIAQAEMELGLQALLQCRSNARLADAGLARDQHNLAFARLRAPSGATAVRSPPRGRPTG